jgi:hypothetical protein
LKADLTANHATFPNPNRSRISCILRFKHVVGLNGGNVITFPELPEFQQVTLKVLRWEERDKRLVIKDAEPVA